MLAGATVTITDVQRGTSRALTADEVGNYVAPSLLPGTYTVRVEAKGFKTVEHQNIALEVGTDVRVDVTLQPGEQAETIQVTATLPLVDATNATLGGTINNSTINDLPLNGRNYQSLLQLRPGIMIYPGGGSYTQSTNGIRPEDNVYIVDGQYNSEAFGGGSIINGSSIGGDAATILPIDSIQEFNTEENPNAEFGWKPGAVVNVGLKSGTNNFHGTAYAFGRDTALDARNLYNTAPAPKTPLSLEQFGATAGGPIKKDKLFFFTAYEGQRYMAGNSYGVSIPETVAQPVPDAANSLPDAIAGVIAAKGATAVSPVSLKLTGCSMGPPIACNGGLYGPNPGNSTSLNLGFPNVNASDNGLAKIDYHINNQHALSGMLFVGNDLASVEDQVLVNQNFLSALHVRAYVADGNWMWTPNSRWVNEARFGINHFYNAFFPGDSGLNASTYGLNTGVSNPPLRGGLPAIYIAGFNFLGNGANHPKIIGPDQQIEFVDHVSYLHGKHAIKFGGELRDGRVTQATYRAGRGRINFKSGGGLTALENFMAGKPKNATLLVGDPTRHLNFWSYAGFVQDDWRATTRLTVNLGLRYEYTGPPSEANNLLGNFDPTLGLVQVGQQISSIYKPDHRDFSPRLGLAWDVTGKGTTVVRSGASIIYSTMAMNMFISQQNTQNAPTTGLGVIPTGAVINGVQGSGTIATSALTIPASQLNWNGTVFPSSATITCDTSAPCSVLGMNQNFRSPYVTTWTVSVQHAFTSNLSLEVAYVGDHGTKLPGIIDINQINPQSAAEIACGNCEANADRPYYAKFPYLQYINWLTNLYDSNYNGLQTTLTQRNVHGLSFVVGYTYSHALDDSSRNWNQLNPQDSYAPGAEYGNSDFDIRHRLTLSTTYAIPGTKSFGQVLQGWQINSVILLQSGQPWNALDATDDISRTGELNDHWDFFGNPAAFTSGRIALPYFAGTSNPNCLNAASGVNAATVASLASLGCYAVGSSVLIPPAAGTFGTMRRNIFRDSGFRNWDLSITKKFQFRERLSAQFRAEFFNVLNHPNIANPNGGPSDYGNALYDDPSQTQLFGCGCATPDVAAANPVIGSGSNRAVQLGLKLIF